MNFSLYDLLSQLVPGFVVYLTLLRIQGIVWDKDYVIVATTLAFLTGYFVNALASWLEGFYYWTWGGKPSNRLLAGKDIRAVRFYHSIEVNVLLKSETQKENVTSDELFSFAMRHVMGIKDTRIETFSANYAFSRNILTACLFVFAMLLSDYSNNINWILLASGAMMIAWQRCKESGYNFAKEVLQTYLRLKTPIIPAEL